MIKLDIATVKKVETKLSITTKVESELGTMAKVE